MAVVGDDQWEPVLVVPPDKPVVDLLLVIVSPPVASVLQVIVMPL
jgi:hypothetical protein